MGREEKFKVFQCSVVCLLCILYIVQLQTQVNFLVWLERILGLKKYTFKSERFLFETYLWIKLSLHAKCQLYMSPGSILKIWHFIQSQIEEEDRRYLLHLIPACFPMVYPIMIVIKTSCPNMFNPVQGVSVLFYSAPVYCADQSEATIHTIRFRLVLCFVRQGTLNGIS